MSPRLALLNLALLGVAAYFGLQLTRELSAPRPLPNPPVQRAAPGGRAVEPPADGSARPEARGQYGVVASRNLFSPSRTDVSATGPEAAGAAAAPRPILHGVVLDDAKSRAFLEDPATKRVFGYAVGDAVGGGKLAAVQPDRVVIARPEGTIEVMLRDPSKPQPAPAVGAQPVAPGAPTFPSIRPGVGVSAAPGMPPVAVPTPIPAPAPQAVPAPPRPLQSIPSDFLRRPTVPVPDASGR